MKKYLLAAWLFCLTLTMPAAAQVQLSGSTPADAARAGLLTGDRQEDGRSPGGRSLGRRGDSGDVW